MKIGYIGLGKMGANMVLHLKEQGVEVIAWNRSNHELKNVESIEELVQNLETPRIIWLMLPAGEVTDDYIDKLIPLLSPGDLLIDGANSFYKDTLRRADQLSQQGIHFMDVGVSGGPTGARTGACLMVGGSQEDYKLVKGLLELIALPSGVACLGKVGAGHFTKMVHNGIEYGMMEAIGEGFNVLKQSQFDLNLEEVARIYNTGSVIESRLIGWLEKALQEDPKLNQVSGKINATGEGEWTVNEAKELGVDVRVIDDSFKVRQESTEGSEDFRAKIVSALRGQFGGHLVKKSQSTKLH